MRRGLNATSASLFIELTYINDDFGRKIKEIDQLGLTRSFEYDINNNLTRVTDPKNQTTQYTYAFGGQMLTRTDASGQNTAYTYNALGQALSAQNPAATYSYTYDAAHRLASITDSRGGKTLNYSYSPGGRLNTLTDNEGQRTDYLYDAVGRLTGIWAPNNDYVAYVYDAAGRRTEKWFPNGVNAQYTWNTDNTLAKAVNRIGYGDSYILSQHAYTYNGFGQRKDATENVGVYTQPASADTYTYDALDNRITMSGAGGTQYHVLDAANQLKEIRQTDMNGPLLAAYLYDANGNLTQKCEGGSITQTQTGCTGASVTSLSYNAVDQLTEVNKDGQISQYAYDAQNRRIRKTVNGVSSHYLYHGPDIYAEYRTWDQPYQSYVHGPNIDEPVIRYAAANDANYFHQDGLGSVVALTGKGGNLVAAQLYDAWGKPQATASLGSLGQYGYTGREPDETGLMYYRARYYDPSVGRFTQRDPAGMPDGVNRYAYVGNDPVNFVDPKGKEIKITRSGSVVNIDFTVVYYGPGAQQEVSSSWDNAIANTWSGSFGGGQYNVTTTVTSITIQSNTSPLLPSGNLSNYHSVYVPLGTGTASAYMGGMTGNWPAASEGWVAAHEFGHFLGLED